ncbi:DUF1453 domain-containing protein [Pseudoxanthomonas broegbernensis]|uniref:DUF1453 domain-containing protein n=1 Tax=Pseudoxanthomonas broegbernensis TaxID=83619 RepID=A0A7V8GNN5_9GAMM|nr:DUF1453 domain-containing protein [Pseudoxanthomonas broegbernensis]KAF1687241.1 DUF1453 domain-containing protein [Pseudoxanthomonas broegbernensis]MBB6065769.1 hypothetical protein [Pseudoxanthomonas broegbernensis]
MPLLLALPLALLLALAIMLALLPLSLWQRYRVARSRRRARGWALALAWWSSLASTLVFALFVAVAGVFWPQAWAYVALAYPGGLLLGLAGHALTRFQATPQGLYYQSNRSLVLGLAVLVAVRLGAGLVQGMRVWLRGAPWPESGWLSHAGLLAMAALLLGYATAQAFGLYRRVRRFERHRSYDRSPR